MCDVCAKKTESVTLANGVFVPAADRIDAQHKLKALANYAESVLNEEMGQTSGIIWDVCGYAHGHDEELPEAWHPILTNLGIMVGDDIPIHLQWALVSLCCEGERMGKYAWKKMYLRHVHP